MIFENVIATTWAIWYARNIFVHEGRIIPPSRSLERASKLIEAYLEIKPPPGPKARETRKVWSTPSSIDPKFNADATVIKLG